VDKKFWLALAAPAVLLAAALFSAWLWKRFRLRRRLRREPRLRHPIVLAHGVLGFDQIYLAGRQHVYFRGVPERLRMMGVEVYRPRVPAVGSISLRAQKLAEAVRVLPAKKVNLIAHSMGGLDARYAIARLGLADRVASLTTIGTPHFGTPLADLGMGLLGITLIGGFRRFFKRLIDLDALHDLTSQRMIVFNREIPDAPGTVYISVVGRGDSAGMNPLLWASHLYLNERAGANDGIVPTASQRWGEVLREIQADHWAQIGWSSSFDAPAFYQDLVRELCGRGF
jgi:triacylglycerol lipase